MSQLEQSDHLHQHPNPQATNSNNVLDTLPPRTAFWAGVVTAVGVLFAAGFIILLVMMSKGIQFGNANSNAVTTSIATTNATAVTNTANTNTAAVKPKLTGKIPLDDAHMRGTGNIVLVEYSDTECPFCKRFHSTLQELLKKYDGQVRWMYKYFPIPSLHAKAKGEAEAIECAAQQGKFWDYVDQVYAKTNSNDSLDPNILYTIADDLKLNRTTFADCVKSEATKAKVEADMAEGEQYGVDGTPYSIVTDQDGNILETVTVLSNGRWSSGAFPLESLSTFLDKYVK